MEASEIEEVVCGEMTTTNEKLLTCSYFELNLEIEITNNNLTRLRMSFFKGL
jgi:hypothetical protein